MSKEIKIGIVGVGHLGQIHLKCLKNTGFTIVGFYDINAQLSNKVSLEFNIRPFCSLEELIEASEVIDIVSSTSSHFEIAKIAISHNKHVFIEKPFVTNLNQAQELISLWTKRNCKVQVGMVERYNPAFLSAKETINSPVFIECHRLAQSNPRGVDVSVIMDLMIHDLDLILDLIKSDVDYVDANGVTIISDDLDICNARIVFRNGVVANLTSSRISMKNMRKMRLFSKKEYVSIDLLDKQLQSIKIHECNSDLDSDNNIGMIIDTSKGRKRLEIDAPIIVQQNAIENELIDFYESIVKDSKPLIDLNDAFSSIKLADLIRRSVIDNQKKLLDA